MTVIIKDIPDMTGAEVLDALRDISDQPVPTGYGGFVVDEKTAYEFLRAYLIVIGSLAPEQTTVTATTEPEPEPEPARRRPTKRGAKQ
jgi:hypothetical protein